MTILNNDRIKILSTVSAVMITVVASFGQAQPGVPKDIIPPSPDAAALQKYGNIPVSLYSGIPQISVPIYEIKARDITVPISLSYHASGIKVNEEASRVGLGWALNAGGLIARTVVNRDDFESTFGFLDTNRDISRIFPADSSTSIYIRNNVQWGTTVKLIDPAAPGDPNDDRAYDLIEAFDNQDYDFEPDHYTYNVNGISGNFFVRQNVDHTLTAILQKKEKVYISLTRNTSTTPIQVTWTLKTGDGMTYVFDEQETYRKNGEGETDHVSSWYLKTITSPKGEIVHFNYVRTTAFVNPVGQFRQIMQVAVADCSTTNTCSAIYPGGIPEDIPGQTYSTVQLQSITWANGQVEFVMGAREDVANDLRLDQVKISNIDPVTGAYTLKEIYDLSYDYFTEIASTATYPAESPVTLADTPLKVKRLRLNSVTRKDPNAGAPLKEYAYKFEYFGGGLPAKTSFSRDHWGYFNASGATSLIPTFTLPVTGTNPLQMAMDAVMGEQRNAGATPRTQGTLSKIYYPTGGSTEFTFEQNTYDIGASQGSGSQNPTSPWLDSATGLMSRSGSNSQTLTCSLDLSDEYRVLNGGDPTNPANYSYTAADIQVTFVSPNNDIPQNCQTTSGGNYSVNLSDGVHSKTVSASANNSGCVGGLDCTTCGGNYVTVHVSQVFWRGTVYVTANLPSGTQFTLINVKVNYYVDPLLRSQTVNVNDQFAYAGGLRVAKIVDYDPESDAHYNTRTYIYHRKEGNDHRSNGILLITPRYSYYDVAYSTDSDGDTCLDCAYVVRQSDSVLPVTGSAGVVVGYSTVTEVHGDGSVDSPNGADGSIVYNFNNAPETVISYIHPLNGNYMMRPPAVSVRPNPLNGTPVSTIYKNSSGTAVKEIIYDYQPPTHVRWDYAMEVRRIKMPGMGHEQVPTDPSSLDPTRPLRSYFNLYLYPIMTSFVYNRSVTEKYDGRVTKVTTYSYDNPAHLQVTKTVVTTSDNHTVETITKYPADYSGLPAGNPVKSMNTLQRYMPTVPVESKTTDVTAGKVLKNTIGVFDFFQSDVYVDAFASNQFIQPREIVDLRAPVLTTDPLPVYSPATPYSNTYYRSTATIDYNGRANIKLLRKNFDMPVGYLWGVKNFFPTAEITNAKTSDVLIETFEAMTSSSIAGVTPHTGRSYSAAPYTSGFVIPAGVPYIIEYWYYQGRWIHKKVEYTAPAGNSTPLSVTDGVAIDDLRVYPKGAMVKSFTYDPFGEMTSSISEGGVTRINEYDTFGRLIRIRNERGEIEKQFTYHYKKY